MSSRFYYLYQRSSARPVSKRHSWGEIRLKVYSTPTFHSSMGGNPFSALSRLSSWLGSSLSKRFQRFLIFFAGGDGSTVSERSKQECYHPQEPTLWEHYAYLPQLHPDHILSCSKQLRQNPHRFRQAGYGSYGSTYEYTLVLASAMDRNTLPQMIIGAGKVIRRF